MPAPLDLVGQRFGRLTVTQRIGSGEGRYVLWRCRCDCGSEVSVSTRDLRRGGVVSCGCNRLDKSRINLTTIPAKIKFGQKGGTNLSRLQSDKPQRNNSTGVRGVSQLPNGAYRAFVYYRRKQYVAGIYRDLSQAKSAVDALRADLLAGVMPHQQEDDDKPQCAKTISYDEHGGQSEKGS